MPSSDAIVVVVRSLPSLPPHSKTRVALVAPEVIVMFIQSCGGDHRSAVLLCAENMTPPIEIKEVRVTHSRI